MTETKTIGGVAEIERLESDVLERLTAPEELSAWINEQYRLCEAAAKTSVQHALLAGTGLQKVKAQLGHGEFLPWLTQNFEGSQRTAQTYMKLARDFSAHLEGKSAAAADLSIRGALRELTEPQKAEGNKKR